MDEKKCTKCGETKPLDEFNVHSMGKFGRRSQCRKCLHRKYMDARGEILAKQAAYRDAHRAEKIARDRAYYWRTRGERLARQREYREENLDVIRERDRAWRAANIDKKREMDRAYYRVNADQIKARMRERGSHWAGGYRTRCRALGLDPVVEDFTKPDVIERYGDSCFYCDTGAFEQLDHYVPVKDGGPHTLDNVRPSCANCNLAKSDLDPDEWLAEQAALDDLTPDELDDLIDAEIDRWTQPKESK